MKCVKFIKGKIHKTITKSRTYCGKEVPRSVEEMGLADARQLVLTEKVCNICFSIYEVPRRYWRHDDS